MICNSKKFSKLGFDDVPDKIEENYVTSHSVDTVLKYKIRHGRIEIDLLDSINEILNDAGFSKYGVKKVNISIPYTLENSVVSNVITVIINNKRYKLNLKDTEVLPSKRQKIDFDNTKPVRWSVNQWAKFYEDLFYTQFGAKSVESYYGNNGRCKGKFIGILNSIKSKLGRLDSKINDTDISEYFRWVFENKSEKFSDFSFSVLNFDGVMNDWYIKVWNKKEKGCISGKKRKWD